MSSQHPVTTVPHFDLNAYLGRWFEVARLPLKWEEESATNITAHYSMTPKGTVRVDNRLRARDGSPSRAIAEATPVEGKSGRLKVNFLPKYLRWIPFTSGDYWVLKLDADYRLALVGTPDRKNLWVLARSPHPSEAIIDDYLAEARRQGFDLSDLIRPVHDGRPVDDDEV